MSRPSPRPRRSAGLIAALAIVAPGLASADEWSRALLDRAGVLLEEAAIARIPPLRPPTPVKVKWKAKKLGAVDLGAALVTLASGDLDGDGRVEVIAVTERDVIVLAPQGRRALAEVARAALPDAAASIQPRDPVATAVVVQEPTSIVLRVRSSTVGVEGLYTYDGGKLARAAGDDRFSFCDGTHAQLARGRDYFDGTDEAPERRYAIGCAADLVDPIGRAMSVDAVLGPAGALAIRADVRCPKSGDGSADCVARRDLALAKVGTAFVIADVDRDGRPEVITSAASAPGDADKITVRTMPATGATFAKKAVFEKAFTGGIGGVVAADVDGDGDTEVIAAVRLPGAERMDLWLLN